jgi:hypothetical protein
MTRFHERPSLTVTVVAEVSCTTSIRQVKGFEMRKMDDSGPYFPSYTTYQGVPALPGVGITGDG